MMWIPYWPVGPLDPRGRFAGVGEGRDGVDSRLLFGPKPTLHDFGHQIPCGHVACACSHRDERPVMLREPEQDRVISSQVSTCVPIALTSTGSHAEAIAL